MTLPLPFASILEPDGQTVNVRAIQDNLDALAMGADTFGGVRAGLRFGYQALTFTASAVSAVETVSHGVGSQPAAIVACGSVGPGGRPITVSFQNYGSDTFQLVGRVVDGTTITATTDCFWLAIG